jgi:PKD repeat protein
MTAFSGVDGTHPFDTADSTVVDTTYTAAKLTVPGVTTVTNGASLIGGVGLDNKAVTVAAPSGWTEAWQSSGAKVAELARGSGSTAGPTGDVTWTLNGPAAGAAWIVPLRPAAAPQAPVASFSSSVASGTAPLVVQFTDTSTNGPTTWAWDFGDGSTASSQSPSHTYTKAGTYTVTLTAGNAGGSARTSAAVTVKVKGAAPVASFRSSVASGAAPLVVQFTDTSTNGPTTWAWDFGDGSTGSSQSPSHTYTKAGTYTVKLTVGNAAGSSSSVSSVDVRAQSQGLLGILAQMLQRLLSQLSALSGTVR